MLRDLAERRKGARQQLEALRAGRERMLEVFASAREALDTATGGFEESLSSARDAADAAARGVDDDLDEAFAELDADIPGGLGETFDDRPTVDDVDDPTVDGPTVDGPTLDVATPSVGGEPVPEPVPEPESEWEPEPGPGSGNGTDARADGGHLRLVEGSGVQDDDGEDDDDGDGDDGDDGDDDGDGDGSLDGADDQGSAGNVEEIFARIRAGRGEDDLDDDHGVGGAVEDDHDEDGPSGEVIALNGGSSSVESGSDAETHDIGDTGGRGDGGTDDVSDDDVSDDDADQAVLDRRDALLEPIEAQLIRQLKRQVSQHENQLLDQLRKRKRSATAADALGSVEDYARVIAAPLRALGAQAFAAGVAVVDPELDTPEFPAGSYDDYAREWVSTALRTRLERALSVDADEVGGADRTEQINRIRATYRDWRNERLAEAAGDLMTFAFNRGVLAAVGDGAPLRWVVDHGGLPSPDAEDNRLAGAVPAGQPFATGDVAPPSHPGCRCVLTPSP